MKEIKRILSILLVAVMLLSMSVTMLVSCFNDETPTEEVPTQEPTETPSEKPTENNTENTTPPDDGDDGKDNTDTNATYTVNVKSSGGMGVEGVMVVFSYVGSDGNTKNAGWATTDAKGVASASLPTQFDYTVLIYDSPKGYTADEDSYKMTGKTLDITLTSGVITDEKVPAKHKYELGDIMYDFTVTTYDGSQTLKLSELLKTNKVVLINYWFDGCTYCLDEFPEMDAAYNELNDEGVAYKDLVEIVALSPVDSDAEIAAFMETYKNYLPEGGLSFPVGHDTPGIVEKFGWTGAPTTLVIDRYGMASMMVEGAMNSYKFKVIFDYFTSDDYTQQVITDPDTIIPRPLPDVEQPSSEEMNEAISVGDLTATFLPETASSNAMYSWPFILGEKGGETCIKASNSFVPGSFATVYINVEITLTEEDIANKNYKALAFDYWCSTENENDVLYVLVDRRLIYTIYGDGSGWETAYPYVAKESGTYELCFVYSKNETTDIGDDTVYIDNLRITTADKIDKETYIYRDVATDKKANGSGYDSYEEVFFNEEDGYYHVGAVDGPILLASLMNYSQFDHSQTVWGYAYSGFIKDDDGTDYTEQIEQYANYSNNGTRQGYCSVNKELKALLEKVADIMGVEVNEDREWLQMCAYYDAYGTDGKQMEDPIKGLATFSAFEAKENVENVVSYDRPIMPRGYLYRFVPTVSAVYRITSYSSAATLVSGTDFFVEGWIVDGDRNVIYTYEESEKGIEDHDNVHMIIYMEAGKEYFIDIAYYDIYAVGTFTFRIENIGETADIFTLASPGYYTGSEGDGGNVDMGTILAGGVDVMLVDGKYYVKNKDGSQGPVLYADFFTTSGFLSHTLSEAIVMGAFNFDKTNLEIEIEEYLDDIKALRLEEEGIPLDVELTVDDYEQYFIELWGEQKYLEREELVANVNKGIFEGIGDYTEVMKKYEAMTYTEADNVADELIGCVELTEELAEALQLFIDVYSFEGVEHAWTKLCFYYKHYGPATVSAE